LSKEDRKHKIADASIKTRDPHSDYVRLVQWEMSTKVLCAVFLQPAPRIAPKAAPVKYYLDRLRLCVVKSEWAEGNNKEYHLLVQNFWTEDLKPHLLL
jgi:hypothetical protein